jgi:hypothetical protein
MGLMARKGALDLEMVWSTFWVNVDGWWCATADYVREEQATDEFVWADFVDLWKKLAKLEKKKTGSADPQLTRSPSETQDFLEYEQDLTKPPGRITARKTRNEKNTVKLPLPVPPKSPEGGS